MFNATFFIKYAADLDEEGRRGVFERIKELGEAISGTSIIGEVPDPAKMTPDDPLYGCDNLGLFSQAPGEVVFEMSFANQEDYVAAKAGAEWSELKDLLADPRQVELYESAAGGDDAPAVITDTTESKSHRVFYAWVRPGADPQMLEHATQMMTRMQDFVEGFNNSKFYKTVESEGSRTWDYVFECDYSDITVYPNAYLMHPIHLCYIDKFFEPMANEWVFGVYQPTAAIVADGPYLANEEILG